MLKHNEETQSARNFLEVIMILAGVKELVNDDKSVSY